MPKPLHYNGCGLSKRQKALRLTNTIITYLKVKSIKRKQQYLLIEISVFCNGKALNNCPVAEF